MVRPDRLTGVYKNMLHGVVALVFRCEVVEQKDTLSHEVDEVLWLLPAEIPERMDEAYAFRMLDALHEGAPSVRAHDGQVLLRD